MLIPFPNESPENISIIIYYIYSNHLILFHNMFLIIYTEIYCRHRKAHRPGVFKWRLISKLQNINLGVKMTKMLNAGVPENKS